MKKLIAALTLLLAFTINANAQDKKAPTRQELAKKDAYELTTFLGLTETQNADFMRLFEQKYEVLEDKNVSQERKEVLAKVMEAKIRATLNATQTEKLEKNPELFNKLTH